MKTVHVTVSGGNPAQLDAGISFSLLASEVLVQIPGSRESVLNIPLVDNPLLNSQVYSFSVNGFDVNMELIQVAEEPLIDDAEAAEMLLDAELEIVENGVELNEVLGEPDSGLLLEETDEIEETPPVVNFKEEEEPSGASIEPPMEESLLMEAQPEAHFETSTELPGFEQEPGHEVEIQDLPEVIELSVSNHATPEEEEETTAFFPGDEGGSDPGVDSTENVVSVEGEKSTEELRHLLEQTQALLQQYDLNNVEHWAQNIVELS